MCITWILVSIFIASCFIILEFYEHMIPKYILIQDLK